MEAPGLDLILFSDADTLVYIDPEGHIPTWSLQPSIVESIAHRIHSQKLLETGSPTFRKLFEPRTQARIAKRRGPPPTGIKYIIDLTPPSAEEDAILFLTELSCPLSIRKWADSKGRWSLPEICVGGEDEPKLPDGCRSAELPEYSPARHRTGIVHILQMLEHITPQVDTPCKFWTFFALAKVYGIATVPQVSVPILAWVYEDSNKYLIDLHPEITYKISQGTQCSYLCRDSFSVLVGEEALLLLHNSLAKIGPIRQQTSLHGRTREIMDDEELQRIEYASISFMEYVVERFIELVGTDMPWLSRLSTFQNILSYHPVSAEERTIVSELIYCLKAYVRGCIIGFLDRAALIWLPNQHTLDCGNIYPTTDFLNGYSSMHLIERIMSRTFWKSLSTTEFTEADCARHLRRRFWSMSVAELGNHLASFQGQQDAIIRPVHASELYKKTKEFNELIPQPAPHAANMPPMVFSTGVNDTWFTGSNVISIPRYEQHGRRTPVEIKTPRDQKFILDDFLAELKSFISSYARKMANSSRPAMEYELTDTLTCLTDEEFKYLPLWAGGNDDGTGGVFMDQNIPFMEAGGFSAPGPSIHTGSTASTYSSFSVVSTTEANSTIHGVSHRATEGHDSEVVSINSDAMSVNESLDGAQVSTCDKKQIDNNDIAFDLDTSACEDDDFAFDTDTDSDATIGMDELDHSIDEFQELNLGKQ